MVVVEVCMGSSCFIRGASSVVAELKRLIEDAGLMNKVVLKGSFCMECCTHGASVRIDGDIFTGIHAKDVPGLFETEILPRLDLS